MSSFQNMLTQLIFTPCHTYPCLVSTPCHAYPSDTHTMSCLPKSYSHHVMLTHVWFPHHVRGDFDAWNATKIFWTPAQGTVIPLLMNPEWGRQNLILQRYGICHTDRSIQIDMRIFMKHTEAWILQSQWITEKRWCYGTGCVFGGNCFSKDHEASKG